MAGRDDEADAYLAAEWSYRINAAVSTALLADVLCCDRTMKRNTILLLIGLLCLVARSRASEQFLVRRLGLDQGLPQSDVHAITQSTDGFLWFATQDGLCRYDGQRLVIYRNFSPVKGQLPANGVRALHVTKSGGLIVLAGDVWLQYRPQANDFVPTQPPVGISYADPSDPQNNAPYLTTFTDSRGRFWYGTRHDGATMVDPTTRRTVTYNRRGPTERRLAADEVWTIVEDVYGRIWIGTHGGGISIVENERIIQTLLYDSDDQRSIPSNIIRTIFRDRSGVMWIGAYAGGLGIWDPSADQLKLYRWKHTSSKGEDDYVRSFATDTKGTVYVGSRTGVVFYDRLKRQFTPVISWPLEYNGSVEGLHVDRFDNLWIGTQRKGLGVLKSGSKSVRWFDGDAWRRNGQLKVISWIASIGQDTLLIGSRAEIGVMTIDDPSPTWIPVITGELLRTNPSPISNIYRIDETGELLISTDAGLFRGHLKSGFTKVECPDPNAIRPNIDYVRAVQRRGDTIYAGTWGAGIRKIHLPSWREVVLDSRAGLPNNTVYAVIPRANGSLLASSNAGILFIQPNGRIQSAGVDQGAQANEFNTGAWKILADGTVLLGGVAGFNAIAPGFGIRSGSAPRIYIYGIQVNGEQQSLRNWKPSSGLQLEPGPWNISIDFGSIATSRPAKVQYRFRMLPGDTTWTYTDVPFLSFLKLTAGQYALEIESSFGTDEWGARLVMPIVIAERPWENPWVLLGAGVFFAVVLVSSTTVVNRRQARRKIEREQLLNEERERIARDLHDDVGAGLARIVIMTDALTTRAQISQDELGRLSEMSRYVIESVRSIVWVIKTTDVSLKTTIQFIRDKADESLSDRDIALRAEIDVDLPSSPLSILKRRNIILACQEAVTNIIRHSRATQVMMKVRYTPTEIVIEFIDNGVGLKTLGNYRSNGVDNMRTRMREINGRFEIRALAEGGTHVTFTIPS